MVVQAVPISGISWSASGLEGGCLVPVPTEYLLPAPKNHCFTVLLVSSPASLYIFSSIAFMICLENFALYRYRSKQHHNLSVSLAYLFRYQEPDIIIQWHLGHCFVVVRPVYTRCNVALLLMGDRFCESSGPPSWPVWIIFVYLTAMNSRIEFCPEVLRETVAKERVQNKSQLSFVRCLRSSPNSLV